MKTLRYRGADLRVKYECPHWFPLAKNGFWLIPDGDYLTQYFIDGLDVVIEISEFEALHENISNVVNFGDLVEIVEYVEWQEQCSDSCFFFENGLIYPHDKPIDSEKMALPDYVGFYRWERDRVEADLLYQSFPTFDYLFLPVPIECKIRVPNASEKLWLTYATQTQKNRDQVIEAAKEQRRLKYEHDKIVVPLAALTRKLDEFIPHARRGVKVINAASQGGVEASKEQQQKREDINRELRKMIDDPRNHFLSLTRCREKIAAKFNVSRRSVEHYTKGMIRKKK